MAKKIVRVWKKVYENDLPYVVSELKESIERPATLILSGEVGTGKTTFCKIFIGNTQTVLSPTYSIVSEIANTIHADFYRLKNPEEVVYLELPLYLEGKEYFLVEWGKNFLNILDKEVDEKFHFYEITLESNEGTTHPSRNYTLKELERI